MAVAPSAKNRVFVSYSRRDSAWVERIRVHLAPLEREYGLDVWDDSQIQPGAQWRDAIREAIAASKVAVLVVSADFLASDFVTTQEVPELLQAAASQGTVIFPLIVSPSRFSASPGLASFQAVNDPARPLITLSAGDQEAALVKLADGVEAAFRLEREMDQYLAPAVIQELQREPRRLSLRPDHRQLTILHSEVRGFDLLAERASAVELGRYLHLYLTSMTEIVFGLDGTLDRYVGNALTAYWGAPIAYTDSAKRACEAALQMVRKVDELEATLLELGVPPLRVDIAITTGVVLVGSLGSQQRFQYSILGNALDILPRLVAMNAPFRTKILLTEFTQADVHPAFETRLLAEALNVKGKAKPIAIYELVERVPRSSGKRADSRV